MRPLVPGLRALPGISRHVRVSACMGRYARFTAAEQTSSGLPPGRHAREDPVRGKNKPESQKEANRSHAKLRAPAKGRTPCSRTAGSSASSVAAPGAPGSSPKPSTPWKSTQHNQNEKGSVVDQPELLCIVTLNRNRTLLPRMVCRQAAILSGRCPFVQVMQAAVIRRSTAAHRATGHDGAV